MAGFPHPSLLDVTARGDPSQFMDENLVIVQN